MKYLFFSLILFLLINCNTSSKKQNVDQSGKGSYTKVYQDGSGGTFKDSFLHSTLISHSWYDSLGVLRYTTPLDISKVSKTKLNFLSGRKYFDRTKVDTLQILNENLPMQNRGVLMDGAQCIFIKENLYQIKSLSHITDTPKELKLYINIYQNVEDSINNYIVFDSIRIPIK